MKIAAKIVFLDRETLPEDVTLRTFDFPHKLVTYGHTVEADVPARVADADIVITNKVPLRSPALAAASRLRLVAVAATGTDIVDLTESAQRGITVSNIRGYAIDTVSEHTFALILALRRNLIAYRASVVAGRWQESKQFCFFDHPIQGLAGATIGIVGDGVIGKAVAEIAKAFSVATSAMAGVGAYLCANLVVALSWHPAVAVSVATASGLGVGLLLSWPLSRLRGVYQAIATLAVSQIMVSLALYADPITGGANGINGIPKSLETWHIILILAVVIACLTMLGRSTTGRAFDMIRQDEHAAVAFGINVALVHAMAFAISGCLAGLAGGLIAIHNHSIVAEEFGFPMLMAALTFVVFGGQQSLAGPLVGAVVLTWLPELERPLADYRMVIYGLILILAITYLPRGIADPRLVKMLFRRRAAPAAQAEDSKHA